MPLAEWQTALGTLVATQAATGRPMSTESFAQLQLAPDEQAWLTMLPQSPGFLVTCSIQRWWRETRLRSLARLTIAALGLEVADQMITEYLATNLCSSLFFLPETIAFLDYVVLNSPHLHNQAIARFECALLLAQEAATKKSNQEHREIYVEFAAHPEELLEAVLRGQELPAISTQPYWILVSPQLPGFWRLATADEQSALVQANNSCTGLKPTYLVPEAFSM